MLTGALHVPDQANKDGRNFYGSYYGTRRLGVGALVHLGLTVKLISKENFYLHIYGSYGLQRNLYYLRGTRNIPDVQGQMVPPERKEDGRVNLFTGSSLDLGIKAGGRRLGFFIQTSSILKDKAYSCGVLGPSGKNQRRGAIGITYRIQGPTSKP